MKIAISISGNTINDPFDPRFGRTSTFCIIDTESEEWETYENPAFSASGGAGVQASQIIAEKGAEAIISGAFGPKAFDTLSAAKIEMYTASGNEGFAAQDVLEMFKNGQLPKTESASHGGHHGGGR
ncbi:MAG: NifB/NifX family molybdenum-iron cluster-binding protein [Anaerolineae bacterium]|jgi:predicted Fe-Mo cluster-binding NifX family protein|nr:NifB/NifX family molybdenum-iron cluster-binding protein [Anaerolineae bacterium]MBT7073635.1 NifB/NifX family molybdenum-iron cluster-binding protein [Anaerolineae bacterium]MBT7782327.1 NifB/NifX family molybdenum-iron cluster-binding protein [Anaerolineae bacterium]